MKVHGILKMGANQAQLYLVSKQLKIDYNIGRIQSIKQDKLKTEHIFYFVLSSKIIFKKNINFVSYLGITMVCVENY